MKQILIDSGPLIALFDSSDKYHNASVEFIKNNQYKLVSTIASMTEALHLLDFSRYAQTDCLKWVQQGAISIENINMADLARIAELMTKYSDLPMDFADACLVYLAEKLNIDSIATVDRDFDIYKINGKKPFTTLIK